MVWEFGHEKARGMQVMLDFRGPSTEKGTWEKKREWKPKKDAVEGGAWKETVALQERRLSVCERDERHF